MSIDTVALLKIPHLPSPPTGFGRGYPVEHRGDATLLSTLNRFDGQSPDEHALALRRMLGSALDAHDDPRGILIFPDVLSPREQSYAALVAELSQAGLWVPKVAIDHVPSRFTQAPAGSHDALVGELAATLGYDKARELDLLAYVGLMGLILDGGRTDFAEQYQSQIEAIKAAMGADFAARYEASLRQSIESDMRKARAEAERIAGFLDDSTR